MHHMLQRQDFWDAVNFGYSDVGDKHIHVSSPASVTNMIVTGNVSDLTEMVFVEDSNIQWWLVQVPSLAGANNFHLV